MELLQDMENKQKAQAMIKPCYMFIRKTSIVNDKERRKHKFLATKDFNKDFTKRAKYSAITNLSMILNLANFLNDDEEMFVVDYEDFSPFRNVDCLDNIEPDVHKRLFNIFTEYEFDAVDEGMKVYVSKTMRKLLDNI